MYIGNADDIQGKSRLNMSVLDEVFSSLVPLHMKSSESVLSLNVISGPRKQTRRLHYEQQH